jgi:hypothetical protein
MDRRGARSRLVFHLAATVLLLVGCDRHQRPQPDLRTERQTGPLSHAEVVMARQQGYLPGVDPERTTPTFFEVPPPQSSEQASYQNCVDLTSINNQGHVVGFAHDCEHGQPWESGAFMMYPVVAENSDPADTATANLPVPAVASTSFYAKAINDAGYKVVNGLTIPTWKGTPIVLYDPQGNSQPLPALGDDADVFAMSNEDPPTLVGTFAPSPGLYHWYSYRPNSQTSQLVEIPPPDGYGVGEAQAISAGGEIVGYYMNSANHRAALAWMKNAQGVWLLTTLDALLPAGSGWAHLGSANAINDRRDVAGWGDYQPAGEALTHRAFVMNLTSHQVTDLGYVPNANPAAGWTYRAYAMNAKGHIVGGAGYTGAASEQHMYANFAFIWTPEWGMQDLNAFVDDPTAAEWVLRDALGINDNDEIIGWARRSTDGLHRGYRLKVKIPGPEFIEPLNGQGCTSGVSINKAGAMVGYSYDCGESAVYPPHGIPFLTDASGTRRLEVPPANAGGLPLRINDDGYILVDAAVPSGAFTTQLLFRPGRPDAPDVLTDLSGPTKGASSLTRTGFRFGLYPIIAGYSDNNWEWYQLQGSGNPVFRHEAPASDAAEPTPVGPGGPQAVNQDGDSVGWFTVDGRRTAYAYVKRSFPDAWVRHNEDWPSGFFVPLMKFLPESSPWHLDAAFDINDAREAVGFGKNGSLYRAFKLNLDTGKFQDLGVLPGEPDTTERLYQANAINRQGHVVGTMGTSGYFHLEAAKAWVYTDALGMTDLNELVSVPPGWVLREANGINDSDEVVGWASPTATPSLHRAFKVKLPPLTVPLRPISYTLITPGRVSINVYQVDQNGNETLVRELLHGAERSEGQHVEYWNGRGDDPTVALPPDRQYRWRLLSTPGFGVEYLGTPGVTYAVDQNGPFWALAPATHTGAQSVAVDLSGDPTNGNPQGVFVTGLPEGEPSLIKQTVAGDQRYWSMRTGDGGVQSGDVCAGANPGVLRPFTGGVATAVIGSSLWLLSQSNECAGNRRGGFVYDLDTQSPHVNRSFSPRLDEADPTLREDPTDMAVGYIGNDLRLVFAYPEHNKVRVVDGANNEIRSIDLADVKAVDLAPDGTIYAITQPITKFLPPGVTEPCRWINPNIGYEDRCRYRVEDNTGKMWAIPPNPPNAPPELVIDELDHPTRAVLDAAASQIFVVERGKKQQITRYLLRGPNARATPCEVYGQYGGRVDGPYDPRSFQGITDIALDASNGLWVSEEAAPRRVAHFQLGPMTSCRESLEPPTTNLVPQEWFGGHIHATQMAVEPDDPANGFSPANIWIYTGTGSAARADPRRIHTWIYGSEGIDYEQLVRLTFNAVTHGWDIDSITNLHYLAGGISAGFNLTDFYARENGNTMYLLSSGGPTVFRYDPVHKVLRPASILTPDIQHTRDLFAADPVPPDSVPPDPPAPPGNWMCPWSGTFASARSMLWTDAAGGTEGMPDCAGMCSADPVDNTPIGECQYGGAPFQDGRWSSFDVGSEFDYLQVLADGYVHRLPRIADSGCNGFPCYSSFPNGRVIGPVPERLAAPRDALSAYLTDDGPNRIWVAFNGMSGYVTAAQAVLSSPQTRFSVPNYAFSAADSFITMYAVDNAGAGTAALTFGRQGTTPGAFRSIRHVFGVLDHAIVFSGHSEDWPNEGVSPIYVYDDKGLYAGQLFGRPSDFEPNGGAPGSQGTAWRYLLSGNAGTEGKIARLDANTAYLYAGWSNEIRAYKITGWNQQQWIRLSGDVTIPENYIYPDTTPEEIGPSANGTGLCGYYTSAGPQKIHWRGQVVPRRTGWHMFGPTHPNITWRVAGLDVGDREGPHRAVWLEAGHSYPLSVDVNDGDAVCGERPVYTENYLTWSEPETNGYFAGLPVSQLFPDPQCPAPIPCP